MSLVVTFNGQFKPYRTEPIKNSEQLKRLSKVAPSFNDLLAGYIHAEDELKHSAPQKDVNKKKVKNYQKTTPQIKRRFYARDIMSTSIKTLKVTQTIADAWKLIDQYQFHHIPIVDGSIVKGIVSDRLLMSVLAQGENQQTTLDKVMTKEILSAQEHTSIADIARAMLNEKIHCLPILDTKSNLKGMITTSDILSLLMISFPIELYA